MIVSSTSWTEDEDFSILLNALELYDKHAQSDSNLPNILMIITGKGPLRDTYMSKVDKLGLIRVSIKTAWLSLENYRLLLASADIGISLHVSSSGLDLPMKIVEIYG